MQLDILALPLQQLEEPIGKFVLADALIANKQQMLAKNPIGQERL